MPEPVFSVVIPVYNAEGFIARTLECLNAQRFKDFEAVIINDGSTDNSQAVISEYIASHTNLRLRLFNQKNAGIAGARNRGITEAKGRYVAFLDHDDFWYPEKLNRCYEIFSRFPEVTAVCHNEALRGPSGKIVRYLNHGYNGGDLFKKLLYVGNRLSASATAVKKEALLAIGLFRECREIHAVEDYDLWLRLARENKVYFIPEILGEYLRHERNASLDFERCLEGEIEVLKWNFKKFSGKNISDFYHIKTRIAKNYLLIIRSCIQKGKIAKAAKYFLKMTSAIFIFC